MYYSFENRIHNYPFCDNVSLESEIESDRDDGI